MQKLYSCVLILFFVIAQNICAQQINKVIISGYGGQHDLDVKTAFLIGYESFNDIPFTGEVILYSYSLQSSFDYALDNDYDLIIRSTSGLSTGLRLAPDYPSVELVMPAGSNNYTQVFFGDVINSPVIITGAGIDSNQTGYQLEFYSIDPITTTNASSFANGYIAGQLAFIANTLGCSFDSARTLARLTGSEGGNCDFYNGFGKIQPELTITDPLPVELNSFIVKVIDNSILLHWQTATEINNFGFEIHRQTKDDIWEMIGFVNGNGNSNCSKDYSFVDKHPQGNGLIKYRLKQIDNDGQFEYSEVITVNYSINNFEIYQNFPNPFNPATTISWQAAVDGNVSVKIYDILGNEVAEILNDFRAAGRQEIKFDTDNIVKQLTSGVYIYTIEIKNNESLHTMINKMTLLK